MDAGFFLIAMAALLPALLMLGGDDDGGDAVAEAAGDFVEDGDGAASADKSSDPPQDYVATPAEGDLFFPEFRPGLDRVSVRLGLGEAGAEISVDEAGWPVLAVTGGDGSMTMTFAGLDAVPQDDVWFELDEPDGTTVRLSLADVTASPSGPLAPTDPDATDDLPEPFAGTGLAPTGGDDPDAPPEAPSDGPGLQPTDPDAPEDPPPESGADRVAVVPEAEAVRQEPDASDDPPNAPDETNQEGKEADESEDTEGDPGARPSVVGVSTDPEGAEAPRPGGVAVIRDFDVDRDILYVRLDAEWTDGEPPVELTSPNGKDMQVRLGGKLIALVRGGAGMTAEDIVVTA